MQTKKQSFIESITNVLIGFGISLAATFFIFPLMGLESTPTKNVFITIFLYRYKYFKELFFTEIFLTKSTNIGTPFHLSNPYYNPKIKPRRY